MYLLIVLFVHRLPRRVRPRQMELHNVHSTCAAMSECGPHVESSGKLFYFKNTIANLKDFVNKKIIPIIKKGSIVRFDYQRQNGKCVFF